MGIFIKSRIFLPLVLIFLILGCSKTEAAGDIILRDLNGRQVNLSGQKGRPAILLFWTTWCRFCRDEIKALNQNYTQIEREGITVFAVNVSESEDKVRKFFKGYPLNFRLLLDENGLASGKYHIFGVPTYILLDENGKVIASENRFPSNYKALLLR